MRGRQPAAAARRQAQGRARQRRRPQAQAQPLRHHAVSTYYYRNIRKTTFNYSSLQQLFNVKQLRIELARAFNT